MSDSISRSKEIFLELIERPRAERESRLEELCAGDSELADEVRSLLEAHETADDFLERPPFLSEGRTDPSSPGLAPGDRVGPYLLREVLGEGGMCAPPRNPWQDQA